SRASRVFFQELQDSRSVREIFNQESPMNSFYAKMALLTLTRAWCARDTVAVTCGALEVPMGAYRLIGACRAYG
ncbi:hypothetical protein HAX54_004307, partial [Datura stramonium]|nr:hypothetical protein [Datura stramonium]